MKTSFEKNKYSAKRKLILSRIQDYYNMQGEVSNFPKDKAGLRRLEMEINNENAIGDPYENSFIKLFGDDQSPTQTFYDYHTGESFICLKVPNPKDPKGEIYKPTYEILVETYSKIDYLRDTICLNPGIMLEIFKREYEIITDPDLAEIVYQEFLVVNTYLDDQKKLILADKENDYDED